MLIGTDKKTAYIYIIKKNKYVVCVVLIYGYATNVSANG